MKVNYIVTTDLKHCQAAPTPINHEHAKVIAEAISVMDLFDIHTLSPIDKSSYVALQVDELPNDEWVITVTAGEDWTPNNITDTVEMIKKAIEEMQVF